MQYIFFPETQHNTSAMALSLYVSLYPACLYVSASVFTFHSLQASSPCLPCSFLTLSLYTFCFCPIGPLAVRQVCVGSHEQGNEPNKSSSCPCLLPARTCCLLSSLQLCAYSLMSCRKPVTPSSVAAILFLQWEVGG